MRVAILLVSICFFSIVGVAACVTTACVVTASDFREKAERTDTRELHLTSQSHVRVDTPYGKVHVRSTDSGGGSLRALVTTRGKSVEEAEKRLERAHVVIDEKDGDVTVSIEFKRDSGYVNAEPAPSVDIEMLVPEGVKLALASDSGSVSADGGPFAEARLKSSYGSVLVENVQGDATVESSSGAVAIKGQRGGRAVATTSYGKVTLEGIDASSLRAQTSSGSVSATNVHAPTIDLGSDYGAIHVDGVVGKLAARTSSGGIQVRNANADVSARSDYGSVAIEGVLKAVNAHTSSGNVKVSAREGSVISDDWRIDSDYGGVALEAPSGFKFDLAAKTAYGTVNVDYAIELPPGSSTRQGSALRGKVNGGGPLVTIESSSGSVRVSPLAAR
jgi:DUF4097 and DUF4098 domain-containing protein YvlB